MRKYVFTIFLCVLVTLSTVAFSGCGGSSNSDGNSDGNAAGDIGNAIGGLIGGKKGTIQEDESLPLRDTTPRVLENTAPGAATAEGNGAVIDYSNISDGYIMAKYNGDNQKIKLQLTLSGGETYTYDVLPNKDFVAFPLSAGNGDYSAAMFLNVEGDQYSQACATSFQANIADEFSPFLRANQFSNFDSSTQAVAKAVELAEGTRIDLKVIENVFIFITENVKYDYDLAANVQSGYIPDVDRTLSTGKGICFDYAALMTSMLRSQGIPCKLVVGYAGPAYHAWISVNVEGIGWVANMIQFNEDSWTMMDPTFAASGDTADPNIIGDGENYNPVYFY